MFVSVGKMFGKGKFRFGVGIRVTKKNFYWMAFAAMFYYMFLLMWYMMVFCFWLVYAMFYGMWWCIKKIFGIGSKKVVKNSKPTTQKTAERIALVDTGETPQADKTAEDSDYSKTIFLWSNQKAAPIRKRSEYPSYLYYECGIQNGEKYHKQMIEEGYLVPAPIQDKLSALKVDELKSILSSQGLQVSGKKADLIDRICENVSEEIIIQSVPDETYSVSENGRSFIENHEAYIKLHQHRIWEISWQEYDSELCKNPGRSFNDVCWGIFNKRLIEDDRARLTLGRQVYQSMYQLAMEEQRYYVALENLLRVLYIDLSGCDLDALQLYHQRIITKANLKERFSSTMIYPGIIKDIGDLEDYYTVNLVEKVSNWVLPFNACSKELFAEIVEAIIEGTLDQDAVMKKLKAGYNKAVDRL